MNNVFGNNCCQSPCFNCKDRAVGCHGKCAKYTNFLKKNDERKAKYRRQKENEIDFIDFKKNSITRAIKGY